MVGAPDNYSGALFVTHVYALTTIGPERATHLSDVRTRTVGVYSSMDAAKEAAIHNYGDIYEAGWYPYAVIEKVALDCLYPSIDMRDGAVWMEWDGIKGYRDRSATAGSSAPQWWKALRIANAASIG
jgi:hypothetical protein